MTLNTHADYPAVLGCVLELHRDAMPAPEQIVGRLESLCSGRHFELGTGEESMACLAQGLTPVAPDPQASAARDAAADRSIPPSVTT